MLEALLPIRLLSCPSSVIATCRIFEPGKVETRGPEDRSCGMARLPRERRPWAAAGPREERKSPSGPPSTGPEGRRGCRIHLRDAGDERPGSRRRWPPREKVGESSAGRKPTDGLGQGIHRTESRSFDPFPRARLASLSRPAPSRREQTVDLQQHQPALLVKSEASNGRKPAADAG